MATVANRFSCEIRVMTDSYTATPHTKGRRLADRVDYDRDLVHSILDESLLCHLGTVNKGRPVVLPTLHWRIGEEVYVHGHSKNGLFAALLDGAEGCLTVTLMDGLVLARSAFHHSVNYRSVMAVGVFRDVTDPDEKDIALAGLMEKIAVGRSTEARAPSVQELKATRVLALTLNEVSAKVRQGPPSDDLEDYALPVWAGVVPLSQVRGTPIQDFNTAPPGTKG